MAFKTGVSFVTRTSFCLDTHIGFPFGRNVFECCPVTVFPIIAVVENTLEPDLVEVIELPVERQRVALSLSCDIILPYLIVVDIDFAVVILFPYKFRIIGSGRRIIIGGRKHHSEAVIEETVTESESEIHLRLTAYPVVACSRYGSESKSVWRIFRNEVDRTADGIAVLIRHKCLADLYCLNHIGRYKVKLNIANVSLCRWQS